MSRQQGSRHRTKKTANPPFAWNDPWIFAAFLVLATALAYQQVWHAGYIWDDDSHLTQNPCIIGPLGFKGIWTTAAATYYPLVLTSFWVQHALWGLNPLPYHLVNVAMHAACGILLWKVLLSLRVPGALIGAALWALHPVEVESVAWITELKNTQSCFFYLLAILFFLKWRGDAAKQEQHTGKWNYGAAIFCALLAILSKSSTVMLPVVLGLCWWWMDGRWRSRNVVALIPFLFVSILAALWTIWEQKFHSNAIGPSFMQTWPERLIVAGCDIWFYLANLRGPIHWPSFIRDGKSTRRKCSPICPPSARWEGCWRYGGIGTAGLGPCFLRRPISLFHSSRYSIFLMSSFLNTRLLRITSNTWPVWALSFSPQSG
jgi:hypothetical protein